MPIPFRSPIRALVAIPLVVSAVGLWPLPVHRQATAPAHDSKTFVIRNARVFDGEKFLPATDVSVETGLIKAFGKNLKVVPGTKEIDASGETLLPGLFDSHTHTWGQALQQALIFGVTTELDMFTDYRFAASVRERQAAGENLDGADLRSAGTLVTAPGGHGTEYGLDIPTLASAADAQSFVDARIAEGSDYIKIVYQNRSLTSGPVFPTLTKEEVAAVIDAAHRRGKMAVVHIGLQADAREVIESGADGLVHIFEDEPPAPDFAALVKQHRAFVIPTLSVNEEISGKAVGEPLLSDPRLSPYIDPPSAASLKKVFPRRPQSLANFANALAAVSSLRAAGVSILAGTDALNPGTAHGVSIHGELELLVQAGLTPTEALRSATSVPAQVFGLNDRGRIAPRLRADLLLVKGDPSTDITATRDIVAIWKTGVSVDRAAARAALEKDAQSHQ